MNDDFKEWWDKFCANNEKSLMMETLLRAAFEAGYQLANEREGN